VRPGLRGSVTPSPEAARAAGKFQKIVREIM
jgi:hypothetical protein